MATNWIRVIAYTICFASFAGCTDSTPPIPSNNSAPKSNRRTFQFTYAVTLTQLKNGQTARVWLPVPSTSSDQDVKLLTCDLPSKPIFTRDNKFGNQFAYIEVESPPSGTIPLKLVYEITRREVGEAPATLANATSTFLQPDAMVPIGGKPLMLLADQSLPQDQLAQGRVLYNVVDDHMQYRKDRPGWGRGDAVWACQSGFGNCTDFHSLFISLARSQGIPSLFEIGFAVPEKRGQGDVPGYHCWAKFKPAGHEWVPVDISEANQNPGKREYYFGHLCENRVAFSTGRDISLEPPQSGPPINFMVYPYVEVAGHPYPADKIERHFSYKDLP